MNVLTHTLPITLQQARKARRIPDGHPNSPIFGHLKFPHPERGVTAG